MTIQEWLVGEIRSYVANQEKDKTKQVNLFLIKDFITNCRGMECSDSEIEIAVRVVEKERGATFPSGSSMAAATKIVRLREGKGLVNNLPDQNRKVN